MTQYATKEDFIERFGDEETLGLCGTVVTGENAIDDDRLNGALTDASHEADSYIAVRYPLELIAVRLVFPEALTRAVCDIARYFLYKDAPTEQVAQRYKEVTSWLLNVSKGVVSLVFSPPLTPIEAEVLVLDVRPVVGLDQGGVFGRRVLDLMPEVHPSPLGYPRLFIRED